MGRTDIHGELITTVVGSFPLKKTQDNANRIIEDQIRLGIDYPATPQLEDMYNMFLGPLADQECGIEIIGRKAYIVDDLAVPVYPIATEGLRNAKKYVNGNGSRNGIRGFKVCVTGPFPLAERVMVGDMSAVQVPCFVERFAHRSHLIEWVKVKGSCPYCKERLTKFDIPS